MDLLGRSDNIFCVLLVGDTLFTVGSKGRAIGELCFGTFLGRKGWSVQQYLNITEFALHLSEELGIRENQCILHLF